ncbi:MAG: hypothetical protein AAF686_02935 [Pseudomonadota bacterium]
MITFWKFALAAPVLAVALSGCMSSESASPTPAPEPEPAVADASATPDPTPAVASAPVMRVMTASELLSTHTGVCTSYSGPSAGSECFNADGTASYNDTTYGTGSGSWRLEANKLCTNYGEGETCATVMTDGSGRFVSSESGYSWTVKG